MNGPLSKVLLGILITLLLGWIGSIESRVSSFHSGQSRTEVSEQINREAPWNRERTYVLRLIAGLDRRIIPLENRSVGSGDRILRLELTIAQIQALDRFFCRTRQPTLPAC